MLIATGLGTWLIGALLYLGNVTGLFPTIPYAGMVTTGLRTRLLRKLRTSGGLRCWMLVETVETSFFLSTFCACRT